MQQTRVYCRDSGRLAPYSHPATRWRSPIPGGGDRRWYAMTYPDGRCTIRSPIFRKGLPRLRRPFELEIFLAAFAGLLLEIAYTRVFSFKAFYYFTYVILGLGLLGTAIAGLCVSAVEQVRAAPLDKVVTRAGVVGSLSIALGYAVIGPLRLDVISDQPVLEVLKLLAAFVALLVPFFSVGLIIAAILSKRASEAPRLYAMDLLGAGGACSQTSRPSSRGERSSPPKARRPVSSS